MVDVYTYDHVSKLFIFFDDIDHEKAEDLQKFFEI